MIKEEDKRYMEFALKLAEVGYGYTWPNPCVGAVIVKNGRIVGIGYHRKKGEDHAEVVAIKDARGQTEGATMYVSLEPHSFYGLVPPCTDAIIKAGIKRVVIAMEDPNPKVSGDGIRILKEHGIEVEVGVLKERAYFLNRFFVSFHKFRKPYVIVKLAITLDGFIADKRGNSKWISNEFSRREVHKLRGEVDAVLVGRRTLERDDPLLTPRMVFPARMPIRIIMGRKFKDTDFEKFKFFKTEGEKWILTTEKARLPENAEKFVKILRYGIDEVDIKKFLEELRKREMLSLLVEGGQEVVRSFLNAGVVDEILLFKSPKIFGSGVRAFEGIEPEFIEGFKLYETKEFDGDVMLRYIRDGFFD